MSQTAPSLSELGHEARVFLSEGISGPSFDQLQSRTQAWDVDIIWVFFKGKFFLNTLYLCIFRRKGRVPACDTRPAVRRYVTGCWFTLWPHAVTFALSLITVRLEGKMGIDYVLVFA